MKWIIRFGLLLFCVPAMGQTTPVPPGYGTQQSVTCGSSSGSLNYSAIAPPFGYIEITPENSGQTWVYICWLGGTCSATTGVPTAVGQTRTSFVNPGTKATCITDGAASVNVIVRE